MAEATALPPGPADEECPLDLPRGARVTLLRFGRQVFTVSDRGTAWEQVLTAETYSREEVARHAYATNPLLRPRAVVR